MTIEYLPATGADGSFISDEYGRVVLVDSVSDIPGSEYLNLVTPQHRGAPRFIATLQALVVPMVDQQAFTAAMPAAFDLDNAVGVQLDAVGVRLGRSRYVSGPLNGVYFSFNVQGLGFGEGIWKGPFDPIEGLTGLDDDHYRLLLRAKVLANTWDGTLPGAQAALDVVFAEYPGLRVFIVDNNDMTMTVGMSGTLPPVIMQALFVGGYIPVKPSGVKVTSVITSENGSPLFGFGADNQHIGGFGRGAWGVTDLQTVRDGGAALDVFILDRDYLA